MDADEKARRALFSLRLSALLNEKNMKQNELARILGVSESTVGKWILRKAMPRMGKIEQISSYFHIGKSYFLETDAAERRGLTVNLHADTARNVSPPERNTLSVVMLPIYGRVPGGDPLEAVEDIIGYTPVAQNEVKNGEFFALKVFGASMEPTINDGNIIIVKKQETVEDGQIAVVLIGDDATVKRIYFDIRGVSIVADNAAVFRPRHYTNEEAENLPIRILGRAVKVSRDL